MSSLDAVWIKFIELITSKKMIIGFTGLAIGYVQDWPNIYMLAIVSAMFGSQWILDVAQKNKNPAVHELMNKK